MASDPTVSHLLKILVRDVEEVETAIYLITRPPRWTNRTDFAETLPSHPPSLSLGRTRSSCLQSASSMVTDRDPRQPASSDASPSISPMRTIPL